VDVEHPTGFLTVRMQTRPAGDGAGDGVGIARAGLLRSARLLMRGTVLVPSSSIDPATGRVSGGTPS
jgi:2-methylaconitate cis-trans-isomerase PrpF